MTNKLERRAYTLVGLEIRAAEEADGQRTIVGHAAVFDVWTDILWGFRERVVRGAFTKSIAEDDVRALWNHDPNFVLGRNKAGTLALAEDDRGLAVTITPPDTQWARDLIVSIERGDVSQMSFAFEVQREEWARTENDVWERSLLEVKLWDVSPVTYPAYEETDVGVRGREVSRYVPKPPSSRTGASPDRMLRLQSAGN